MEYINTKEAAQRLGVSVREIQRKIKAGVLPSERLGREWKINLRDLRKISQKRGGANPRWRIINRSC